MRQPVEQPDIGFKKSSDMGDDKKVQAHELASIKKRLVAIKKAEELHSHYRTMGIDDILEEIVFHVENRDRTKCTYARALNFAILALKKGKWGTPKGLIKKREEEHYIAKKDSMRKDSETMRGLTSAMGVCYAAN